MATSYAKKVLEKHKGVTFVKRMLEPEKYPTIKNKDGSVSSHLMSSGEVDGRHFVYPTLRYRGGKLQKDEDPGTALDSGNVIFFDTREQAEEFAQGSWKDSARDMTDSSFPNKTLGLDLGDESKLLEIGRSRPDMSKPAKPATDGALGGVISALAGNGSLASKGAAIGGLIGPVGSVVGGGLGLVADIFGSMGDSQDDKDRKAQESMNNLRASLSEWHTLE